VAKILQTYNDDIFKILEEQAKKRGVTVQELVRSVIVPDWLRREGLI
jgi:hypothetical protein